MEAKVEIAAESRGKKGMTQEVDDRIYLGLLGQGTALVGVT